MKERAGTVPDESGSRLTSAELDAGGPGAVPADEYAYQYDDIGNRITSTDLGTNRTYTANFLNQYTLISNLCDSVTLCDDFVPQYDLDGNQTLVKTSTGVWTVAYNGENRPVSWTCGTTNIVMAYDRMGRRVLSRETVGGVVTGRNHTFVYDGYLCLRRLDAATKKADMFFTWDPAESVATRLLMVERPGKYKMHVTHDGNKNVSELVFFSGGSGIAAHYEYAPFGAVTASTRSTSVTAYDFREYNPFRFSSEYADDTLGLVYYNYRHYNPMDGRWTSRDPMSTLCEFSYCMNNPVAVVDMIGLHSIEVTVTENGNHSNAIAALSRDSRLLGSTKWGATTAPNLLNVNLCLGTPVYDARCRSCKYEVPPRYFGTIDLVSNMVHAGDRYMGYTISQTFADQVKSHEDKHVAIARGMLKVFSDAESEMQNLVATGLSDADCFINLEEMGMTIDEYARNRYLRLEQRVSAQLDSVENVVFERAGFLWLSSQPVLRGNFNVDAAINTVFSR